MAMGSASCISLVVLVALATAASGQLSSTFYDTSCPRALATIKRGACPPPRDSTTASASLANSDLPGPSSSRSQLEAAFLKKNLNTVDMVALSGAHTIGKAQCSNFRTRIYGGDTNINTVFATSLKANCPQSGGNTNLANLDTTTPNAFDNAYYTNLLSQKGLLHSDQVLFNNDTTDNTVRNFASNAAAFSSAFTTAMIKMGNIAPLTGTQGQIRLSCSKYREYSKAGSTGYFPDPTCLISSPSTAISCHLQPILDIGARLDDESLANLDTTTANTFDNAYYTNLMSQKGLLHSDQVLFNNDTTDNTVRNFASNPAAFSSAFTTAMIKMGNIAPKTGTQGQIRLSCSRVNS
ncbi:Peroxidase [Triticum urartu]|uniref:Peroxidase n=1 Tax=Triticum urartu TaxID=4572 RepID=M7YW41_TRIUA|nr:Peroxidase [Triticum urartu]